MSGPMDIDCMHPEHFGMVSVCGCMLVQECEMFIGKEEMQHEPYLRE